MAGPPRGSVMESRDPITERGRFWRIAGEGAAFQAGSAAIDSPTIVASLVFREVSGRLGQRLRCSGRPLQAT